MAFTVKDNRVTGIGLYRCRILTLPDFIRDLTALQTLNLASNEISTFPEPITRLKSLRKLDIRNNKLSELPQSIINLTSLQELKLENNKFTIFPEELVRLKWLKILDFSHNQIKSIPTTIVLLMSLQSLRLRGNGLTTFPEEVVELRSLKTLNLDENSFSTIPESILKLKSLESLTLRSNQFSTFPEALTNLIWLKDLNLGLNQLNSLPDSITKLESLQILDLDGNKIETLPESIGYLKSIQDLNFISNQLNFIPESIGNLKTLKKIDLRYNQLSVLPESLGALESIEKLWLEENQIESIPESIGDLKSLEMLFINSNQLKILPKSLGSLISLEVIRFGRNEIDTLPILLVKLFFMKKDIKLDINPYELRHFNIEGQIKEFENLVDVDVLLPWNEGDDKDILKILMILVCLRAGYAGITPILQVLKEGVLTTEIKNFVQEKLLEMVENLTVEDVTKDLPDSGVESVIEGLKDSKKISHHLNLTSMGDDRIEFSQIERILGSLIRKSKRSLPEISWSEKVKNAIKRIPALIKSVGLLTWIFLFLFAAMVLIGILVVAPIFHTINPMWLVSLVVIGIFFSIFAGLGVFPSVSGYIEKAFIAVEKFGDLSEKLEEFESKTKSRILFLLDIGVVIYLINSIRKLVKLITEMELIPFTVLIEFIDIVLMGLFFSILSNLMVIQGLYSRGIRHLVTAASEPLEAKGKLRYIVLPLGIVGAFAFVVIESSTWWWPALIAKNISVAIGAIVYIELKFKERWRLRFTFYGIITLGIIGTYACFYFFGLASSTAFAITSGIIFLLILVEGSRRSYWLTDCFEPFWQVERDSKLDKFHGTLIESNEAILLKELEDLIQTDIRPCEHFLPITKPETCYKMRKGKITSIRINRLQFKELQIRGKKLASLPESIGNLTSLEILHLVANELKTLPESIGNLKSLKTLELGFNDLTILPESIGNLKSLQTLDLHANKLTSVPESISDLKELNSIDLGFNRLEIFPKPLLNLNSLQKLDLSDNALSSLPDISSRLPFLEELDLHSNNLTIIPESLGYHKSLKYLNLKYNEIKTLPESVKKLKDVWLY